jgi:hypothetical protein
VAQREGAPVRAVIAQERPVDIDAH